MQKFDPQYMRSMAVFRSVAILGSFRAAAEEHQISPPFVSQMISELEDYLGAQLLYRSTRKLTLSSDGEALLAMTNQMMEAFEKGLVPFFGEVGRRELSISLPSLFETRAFANFLRKFQSNNQNINLNISFSANIEDPAEAGMDLAIRVGWLDDDSRPARKLFESDVLLMASPEVAGSTQSLQDLEELIWFRPNTRMNRIDFTDALGKPMSWNAPNVWTISSAALTRQLVSMGMGFTVLPEFSVRDVIASGQLTPILSQYSMKTVSVYALYSARTPRLSNARDFVDELYHWLYHAKR